jgi:hypothetical protein
MQHVEHRFIWCWKLDTGKQIRNTQKVVNSGSGPIVWEMKYEYNIKKSKGGEEYPAEST